MIFSNILLRERSGCSKQVIWIVTWSITFIFMFTSTDIIDSLLFHQSESHCSIRTLLWYTYLQCDVCHWYCMRPIWSEGSKIRRHDYDRCCSSILTTSLTLSSLPQSCTWVLIGWTSLCSQSFIWRRLLKSTISMICMSVNQRCMWPAHLWQLFGHLLTAVHSTGSNPCTTTHQWCEVALVHNRSQIV